MKEIKLVLDDKIGAITITAINGKPGDVHVGVTAITATDGKTLFVDEKGGFKEYFERG